MPLKYKHEYILGNIGQKGYLCIVKKHETQEAH